jgi:hypothetical protein
MRKTILLATVLFVIVGTVRNAEADEVAELKKELAELQGRLAQLEAKQKAQDQEVKKQISEQVSKAVDKKKIEALPDSIKWIENVKLSGDFRYRHESMDKQSSRRWGKGRNRHRIRARLGLDAKVNDQWDLGFRIASGTSSPTSTNQTLDDGFSSKDIWLDLAYFNWHPLTMEGLNVYGGKMKLPFYRVGKNQLIWDSDLNPEGIAAKYKIPLGAFDALHIDGGGFWAEESSSGVDQSLWGAQAYLKHDFEDKSYLLGGASYFDYGNTKGQATIYDTSDSFGNTVDGTGKYVNDYDILEGFAEYGFKIGKLPVAVFGNYVQNTAATTSGDTGWLTGFKLNKAKEPGSWEFGYNYRKTEEDAVVGVFSDSDFIDGGTDGKGHQFGLKYQLAENLQAGVTFFAAEMGSDDDDFRRLMLDLIFKF